MYVHKNAGPNKIFFLSKRLLAGCGVGIFTSIAVIKPAITLATLLVLALNLDSHLRKMWIYTLGLVTILVVWVFIKCLSINEMGLQTIQDIYLVVVLGFFSIFSLKDCILKGFVAIFSSVVLLDLSSNLMQATLGIDLLGNIPDLDRSDGIRLVGMLGHSFISLGLYFSLFLLLSAAGFKWYIAYMPLLMMLIVGSLRAYIFIPLLIFCTVIFNLRWRAAFFIAIAISMVVAAATVLSVSEGLLSESSGNAFRVFAWKNAIDVIATNPYFGADMAPPFLPPDFVVTEQNIIDYQIYESSILQDAARYGLPFVLLKLTYIYWVGILNYQKGNQEISQLAKTKNFIVFFIVVDYLVFSYFSMPATAMVAAVVLGTREQKYER